MMTYSELGNNGRLGNQMFQYAALLGTSYMRGRKFMIPNEGHSLIDTFLLGSQDDYNPDHIPDFIYTEPDFAYNAGICLVKDNTELKGFFQSPNYFTHCEDTIRKNFIFKPEIDEIANIQLSKLVPADRPICSLHIRRTDYLTKTDYHPAEDLTYIKNAVEAVGNNIKNVFFLVFSDDISWCKENIGGDVAFSENRPAVDMCMMSKCPIHIIANSSFSWWGAWLSKSKAVIAPKNWFGPSGPKDWSSVYYPTWVQL